MLAVAQARALLLAVVTAMTMEQQALYERVTVLNKQALDEIGDEKFAPARKHLLEAVLLAKKGGAHHPLLARTFIHLGALTVMEGGPRGRAIQYFKRAQEVQADVRMTEMLARADVMRVFREAKAPDGLLASCSAGQTLECPWREDAGDPELPRRIKALDCYNRDVVQEARPLILRCAANDLLKVERVTLYYRKGDGTKFKAWDMTRNARGWWTITLPADQVRGKSVAFYMVAKDAADDVVTSHGAPDSPDGILIEPTDECRCVAPPDEPVDHAVKLRP